MKRDDLRGGAPEQAGESGVDTAGGRVGLPWRMSSAASEAEGEWDGHGPERGEFFAA